MNDRQGVVFIPREGMLAKGEQWHVFMKDQRDTIDSYRLNGWKLVSAVGVHGERALQGALLYFSREP